MCAFSSASSSSPGSPEDPERDLVRHRGGRQEDGLLLAEQLRRRARSSSFTVGSSRFCSSPTSASPSPRASPASAGSRCRNGDRSRAGIYLCAELARTSAHRRHIDCVRSSSSPLWVGGGCVGGFPAAPPASSVSAQPRTRRASVSAPARGARAPCELLRRELDEGLPNGDSGYASPSSSAAPCAFADSLLSAKLRGSDDDGLDRTRHCASQRGPPSGRARSGAGSRAAPPATRR